MKAVTVIGLIALCALVRTCTGTPNCEHDALWACFHPPMTYATSPQGQQLVQLNNNGVPSEAEARRVCRVVQTAASCVKDYVDRCVDQATPDIHEFIRGTNDFMTVCGKPTFYADVVVVQNCAERLYTSEVAQACAYQVSDMVMEKTRPASGQRFDPLLRALWTSHMLRDLCCNIEKVRTCLGNEVENLCEADAVRVNSAIYGALKEAYGCNGRINSCPA